MSGSITHPPVSGNMNHTENISTIHLLDIKTCCLHRHYKLQFLSQLLLRLIHGKVDSVEGSVSSRKETCTQRHTVNREFADIAIIAL